MTNDKPDGCDDPPIPGCDLTEIDDLKCEAEGISERATYIAGYQKDLTEARAKYDTTRREYRTARHDVAQKVADLQHRVTCLIDRIRCLIDKPREIDCLDRAVDEVFDELDGCPQPGGCCVEHCDFDGDANGLDKEALAALIAKYQKHVDTARTCFTTLTGEPAELKKRVAALEADIDAIAAGLGATPPPDLKRSYATARVADRRVKQVWWGFPQIADFVDCLCQALTCWGRGADAIGHLKAALAVLKCKDTAKEDHCKALREKTADEILAAYDRCCPPPDDDDCDDNRRDDNRRDDNRRDDNRRDDDRPPREGRWEDDDRRRRDRWADRR
jgi:hypothetical protein